jgi:hypothetical protein
LDTLDKLDTLDTLDSLDTLDCSCRLVLRCVIFFLAKYLYPDAPIL